MFENYQLHRRKWMIYSYQYDSYRMFLTILKSIGFPLYIDTIGISWDPHSYSQCLKVKTGEKDASLTSAKSEKWQGFTTDLWPAIQTKESVKGVRFLLWDTEGATVEDHATLWCSQEWLRRQALGKAVQGILEAGHVGERQWHHGPAHQRVPVHCDVGSEALSQIQFWLMMSIQHYAITQ